MEIAGSQSCFLQGHIRAPPQSAIVYSDICDWHTDIYLYILKFSIYKVVLKSAEKCRTTCLHSTSEIDADLP